MASLAAGEARRMPRHRHHIVVAVALAALALAVLLVPATALAATPGSGLWYWPAGTEDFKGRSGWWDYRPENHSWHMAQDMPASVGHPVYAIADGVVLESKPASGYGGVLVVLHKTATGAQFKAVYGHIRRGAFPKGSKVRAGQVIGRVNGVGHLHFGIHPGRAYPPDRNPYRGHTYDSSRTYGWVNPISYLKTNPRVKVTPPLPVVATVETVLPPRVLGTAAGAVFWTVETTEGVAARYSRPIEGSEVVALDPQAELPSLDTTRFAAVEATGSFTLKDRLPALKAAYSARTPSWGRPIAIKGTLRNAAGLPFVGATVTLERSTDATSWSRVGSTLTGTTGAWAISYKPARVCSLRVRVSPSGPFLAALAGETTVAPRAGLRAPEAPSSAARNVPVEVAGTLAPRHAAGTHTVVLRFQKLSRKGVWADAFTTTTTNRDTGTVTRYYARVSLAGGSWRLRAETAADSLHGSATTGWFSIAAR
jgi:murein DD-endopeptidase MepM/ murein hydrolase activator NlpD